MRGDGDGPIDRAGRGTRKFKCKRRRPAEKGQHTQCAVSLVMRLVGRVRMTGVRGMPVDGNVRCLGAADVKHRALAKGRPDVRQNRSDDQGKDEPEQQKPLLDASCCAQMLTRHGGSFCHGAPRRCVPKPENG